VNASRGLLLSEHHFSGIESNLPSCVWQLAPQTQTVTVTADVNQVDVLSPDPAQKVFVSQDLLDVNPGRPGAPVSLPGYPIETASSGIKAPQYFAPVSIVLGALRRCKCRIGSWTPLSDCLSCTRLA